MRIELQAVTKGRSERALPETSVTFESGAAVLVCAETEQRPTVLGLIASGRMRPATGSVTVDGRTDAAHLRRAVALVDALDVSEPEPNVSVAGVVAEELMFAGLRSHPVAARRWLDDFGLGTIASTPIGNVDPSARIRILCELAALRPGVSGLVLTSPDRHGGDPAVWWGIAQEFAARGLAVLVIAGRASELVLGVGAAEAGAAGVGAAEVGTAELGGKPDAAASERRTIDPTSEDDAEIVRLSADPPAERTDAEAATADAALDDPGTAPADAGQADSAPRAEDDPDVSRTDAEHSHAEQSPADPDSEPPDREPSDREPPDREIPDEGRRS